jgi:lactate dehydrogenase-like 2-hydroxyacid dehydrogenase
MSQAGRPTNVPNEAAIRDKSSGGHPSKHGARVGGGQTRLRVALSRGESTFMQLGMIGLGRMGANMVRRLQTRGHRCVVFDRSPEAVSDLMPERAVRPREDAG